MNVIRTRVRRVTMTFAPALVAAVVVAAAGVVPATNAASDRSSQKSAEGPCAEAVLGIAQQFNVFVHHDYGAVGTDVKGRAAAGGNVSIDSYAVGVDLPPDPSRADLIAGADLKVGGGGAQAPNGSVTYGATVKGTITTPHGQVEHLAPPFDMNVQFTQLANQATAIAALTPNGTAGGPSYAYDLTGTSTTTNVFRIAATDLQTAQVIRIKVPAGSTTIVVVTGPSYSSARFPTAAIQFWNGSQYVQLPDSAPPALEALRANLLWDFPDATSVQIGGGIAWQGTVLAPLAAVVFPGNTQLNGTLIAASLENSAGAARNHPFTGCVPIGPPPPTLQAEDDHYAVQQPETLHVAAPGVLQNDTKPAGATVTAELVAAPKHGNLSLAADGSFTYTPAKGFTGKDTFTYRARQGSTTSNVATVTIDVSADKARLVTFVARVCPEYTDVMANLARNDIQESLEDLGPNSVYSPGQPIDPDIEVKAEPSCRPLPAWQLTLGRGIESRAVSGPWGSLSIVTTPFTTPIVTRDETSLLNDQGQPTGRRIAGAVTVTLDDAQAALASTYASLWVQGGTPTDPILYRAYPGQYGFAALRCAVDNLNGDNVEWIAYPTGATHVFCYAYYVQPPPASGAIVVRKVVTTPAGATETFPFTGNVTYNADNRFELHVDDGAPAAETFLRAETEPGDTPWNFSELVPPGWSLTSIVCTSKTGDSHTTTDVGSAETTVTLAGGDVVTCTYTNAETPPEGSLRITKTTTGGTGTFRFTVTPAGATGGSPVGAVATTTKPGVEVAAKPSTISLSPGSYTIAESLPPSDRGTWSLTGVHCNGAELPARSPVTVKIVAGSGLACRFENRFVPSGSIRVSKLTWGGTGTAGFAIYPLQKPTSVVYFKKAVVKKEGVVVRARGSATNALPLGRYRIREFAAPGTDPIGWALTSVVCNGALVGASQGAVVVTLTAARPRVDCIFTNTFTPGPAPPEPPNPPSPTDPDPLPVADLQVTKTADRTAVSVGATVTYTIEVSNTGKAAAQGVVLAEKTPRTNATILSVEPSQGVCRTAHAPATCYLGTIEPGQTVTIVAKLKATKVGPLPNSVAVSAATDVVDPPTDGVAGEVVTEKPPQRPVRPAPPFVG